MYSQRFERAVDVTRHARKRMADRNVDDAQLLALIEVGETRYKDASHLWIYKHHTDRDDNFLCAAVVLLEHSLIVKTVMHRFQLA